MATDHHIPVDMLRQLLRLDPETGKLYWRQRGVELFRDGGHSAAHNCAAWNAKRAGREAFTAINAYGYRFGTIFDRPRLAHRVVFALANRRWPQGHIDHRDGDPLNNRPGNLREATIAENMRNRRANRAGTSAFKGVSWKMRISRWEVRCADPSGEQRHLGYFTDEIDAARAYDDAAREWHGAFAKLNF